MSAPSPCPPANDLKRLATGRLSVAELDPMVLHLEGCDSCLAHVRSLSGKDTLVDAVLQASTVEGKPEDPIVTQVIARMADLKTAAPAHAPEKVVFPCGHCGKKIKAKLEQAGRKVKCPGCGKATPVPKRPAGTGPAPLGDAEISSPRVADERTVAPQESYDEKTVAPKRPHAGADTEEHGQQTGPGRTADAASEAEAWDFLAPAQQPDEIGRLERYRVLKVLGAGGMGVVFRAEDPDLERPVALKAMLPALAVSPSAKKRFLREAKAAAALKHDHVVAIYQVGEDRGAPFLAMEFLEGEPLDNCLHREGKLPVKETLRIGREIAEGLAAAHEKGLIHRDIKPGNIWLESRGQGPGGRDQESGGKKGHGKTRSSLIPDPRSLIPVRVKILDFGLARTVGDQAGLTQSGAIIGTPAYMAPEQASGKPVDHRCDLFSLGCVLYRMSTGETPFKGNDTLSVLSSLAMDNPKTPLELDATLPLGLSELIMRLLAKNADERLGSAHEVIESLHTLESEFASSKTAGPSVRKFAGKTHTGPSPHARNTSRADLGQTMVAPARKRSRTLVAAIAGGLFGFTALLGGIIWIMTNNGTIEIDTKGIDGIKIVVEQDGGQVLILDPASKQTWVVNTGNYTVKLHDNPAGFEIDLPRDRTFVMKRGDKKVVSIRKLPDAVAKGAPSKDDPKNTREPPVDLSPLDKLDPKAIPESDRFPWQPNELVGVLGEHRGRHWGYVDNLAFSADGKSIIVSGRYGKPQILDAMTLQEKELTGDGMDDRGSVYVPQHKMLVTSLDGIWLWDTSGPKARRRFKLADEGAFYGWSNDGKTLAAIVRSEVLLWDISGPLPKEKARIKGFSQGLNFLTLAADGTKVTTTDGHGQKPKMQLWDVTGGEPKQIAKFDDYYSTAFSPDGKKLAIFLQGGRLKLFDVAGPEPKQLAIIEAPTLRVLFAPDGNTLACFQGDQEYQPAAHLALYDVRAAQPVKRGKIDVRWVSALAFSADGKALAVGSSLHTNVRVWDLAENASSERVPVANHRIIGIALTPESKTAVTSSTGMWGGDVRVWEFAGGAPRALGDILECPDYLKGVAISSDGKSLATASNGDTSVRVFDISSFPPVRTALFQPGGNLGPIQFAQQGKSVLIPYHRDGKSGLAIWSVAGEKPHELATLPQCRAPGIVTPNGQTLICNHEDGKLRLWDLGGTQARERAQLDLPPPFSMDVGISHQLALLADGKLLAGAAARAGTDQGLLFWNLAASPPGIPGFMSLGTDKGVTACALGPNRDTVAAADGAGNVVLWDVKSLVNPKRMRSWQFPGTITQLFFAADGRHLITVNGNGTAYVLRLAPPPGTKIEPAVKEAPPIPKTISPGESPLDKLDPKAIPEVEQFTWQPKELVAVVGENGQRHWSAVADLALSPNGRLLASVSEHDRVVRLRDPATMQVVGEVETLGPQNQAVDFSADSKWLAVWSTSNYLRLWDCSTKTPRYTSAFNTTGMHGKLRFAFGNDPRLIGYAMNGDLVVWDPKTNPPTVLASVKASKEWTGGCRLAVAPGGKVLATGSYDGVVKLWELDGSKLKEFAVFKGFDRMITALAFSTDGKLLFTGDESHTVRVHTVDGQKSREKSKFNPPGGVILSIAVDPAGARLAIGSATGLSICALNEGEVELLYFTPIVEGPTALAWGTAEQGLFLGRLLGGVQRCKVGPKKLTLIDNPSPASVSAGVGAVSRSGRLALWHMDGLSLWDPHGRTFQLRGHTTSNANPDQGPVALSPDGNFLICQHWSDKGKAAELWDLRADGPPRLGDRIDIEGNSELEWLPDGKTLVANSYSGWLQILERDGTKLKTRNKLQITRQKFTLACSRDGKTLATLEGPHARIWSLTGSEPQEITSVPTPKDAQCIALSPDGRTLAFGHPQPRFYDLSGKTPREILAGDAFICSRVCFSPDGKTLAGLNSNVGGIILWDASSGKQIRTWNLPGLVRDVAFSEDGRHLYTFNGNGTVYVLRLAAAPPANNKGK